jgi:hypothetical protein
LARHLARTMRASLSIRALVLRRVATHGANVIERALFATHQPFTGRQIGIGGIGRLPLERGFVKTRRQQIDQIDIAREFIVFLLGDAARDEDAKMADGLVDGVDDGLAKRPDFVHVFIEIKDIQSSACCGGVMLSPLEQNTTIGERMLRIGSGRKPTK